MPFQTIEQHFGQQKYVPIRAKALGSSRHGFVVLTAESEHEAVLRSIGVTFDAVVRPREDCICCGLDFNTTMLPEGKEMVLQVYPKRGRALIVGHTVLVARMALKLGTTDIEADVPTGISGFWVAGEF